MEMKAVEDDGCNNRRASAIETNIVAGGSGLFFGLSILSGRVVCLFAPAVLIVLAISDR